MYHSTIFSNTTSDDIHNRGHYTDQDGQPCDQELLSRSLLIGYAFPSYTLITMYLT